MKNFLSSTKNLRTPDSRHIFPPSVDHDSDSVLHLRDDRDDGRDDSYIVSTGSSKVRRFVFTALAGVALIFAPGGGGHSGCGGCPSCLPPPMPPPTKRADDDDSGDPPDPNFHPSP